MPDGTDAHAVPQDGGSADEARDDRESEQGREIIEKLRAGELPQMVDWFDPGLLAKVGMRSIISATLGSYTDQRLMQAATDNVATDKLQLRYDYSENGEHKIEPDDSGAVWVDYIADLGDGFESTYAMAYLMAADTLKGFDGGNPEDETGWAHDELREAWVTACAALSKARAAS